jgi:ketosteroid isomerase-like protein
MNPKKIISGIVAAGLLVLAYRAFFLDEKAVIRKRLQELAKTVSISKEVSVIGLAAKIEGAAKYFTKTVVIQIKKTDGQSYTLEGRENLKSSLMAVKAMGGMDVKFALHDTDVELNSDKSAAEVGTTATAKGISPSEFLEVAALRIYLIKEDGQWLINRVENTDTLQIQ